MGSKIQFSDRVKSAAEPSLQPSEKDPECLIRLEIVYKWEFGLKRKIEAYFLKEEQNGQED